MTELAHIHNWPDLERPVLVVAMSALAAGLVLTSRLSLSSGYLGAILPAILVASGGGC